MTAPATFVWSPRRSTIPAEINGQSSSPSGLASGSTRPTFTSITSSWGSDPTACRGSRSWTAEQASCTSSSRRTLPTAYAGANPVYESAVMRFYYTSLTAPWSAIDYDMETRERTVVKEQPVRGGYDRGEYE